nr:hypothetical protein [Tanacetum cinerariifolium]
MEAYKKVHEETKEKEKERAFRVDEIKVSVVIEVGQTKAIDGGLNYDNRLANYEQPSQHFLMFDYDPQEGELQVKTWDLKITLGKIMEQHLGQEHRASIKAYKKVHEETVRSGLRVAIVQQSMKIDMWEIKEKLAERREQMDIRAFEEDKRREE